MASKNPPQSPRQAIPSTPKVPVVLATSVMLTFISFWRAAAIVLCDLGSSAFYVGGIAEQAVGHAAPWFILGVMVLSAVLGLVYIEACVMFVRGGVYRIVKTALGGTLAKISVSALMFDYILTGPISGVSAGQYLTGLLNELLGRTGAQWTLPRGPASASLAVMITLYFWRKNIKGIHESSARALRIMQITTIMVALVIVWSGWTILRRGAQLPPLPTPGNLIFPPESLGWLRDSDWVRSFGFLGILIAFGHSVLAMSGIESLAQVNREIAYPKVQNLKRAALVIFVYSLLFTSLVSFFAEMIIPDADRPQFYENLISGIAMNVEGPYIARLVLQIFVVIVGFLILSGAVNTSIIGANGVLNRVSEDGVLSSWFRLPHDRYGTSYRIINMLAVLQIATIVASHGDTHVLGEAYAFGVLWSFIFNSLSMFVLRYKRPEGREWKAPLNLRLGRMEVPVTILAVLVVLLAAALANLFTKQVATVSGLILTAAFFTLFTVSERISRKRRETPGMDQFHLIREETVSVDTILIRPVPVLVATRDFKTLQQLEAALGETDTEQTDVVVMTVRVIHGTAAGYKEIFEEHLFTEYEQLLFTQVVARAEKTGKPVKLLTVPSNHPISGVVNVAIRLGCSRVFVGASEKLSIAGQARLVGDAWEEIDQRDKTRFELIIVPAKNAPQRFQIGAHAPQLTEDDIELTHKIWLEIVRKMPDADFHHRDVVSLALRRFKEDLHGSAKEHIIESIQRSFKKKPASRRGARRF